MSLDTSRTGPHPGRLTAPDARQRLEHAHHTREAQLQALEASGQSADDHLMSAQAEAIGRVLKEIEEAFARIENGTYGACLNCSKAVPVERLEILPYTRYCVACQRRAAA
ncbi:TraR/DksA C4-type zinc finger protein [Streptomyces sp. NPDC021093]|uniref:TraR/DksA C4-type zinc finger protein n=1 Tax=Streptomyces sp. NPDC021093 TaxID=3365112 RepID=UPI00379F21AD